jgi:hypothetical protein
MTPEDVAKLENKYGHWVATGSKTRNTTTVLTSSNSQYYSLNVHFDEEMP